MYGQVYFEIPDYTGVSIVVGIERLAYEFAEIAKQFVFAGAKPSAN